MKRITTTDLQDQVDAINRATDSPLKGSHKGEDGHFVAHPGHYRLAGAYGGWGLQRICADGHGCETIIEGFRPKRELNELLHAFRLGLRAGD